MLEPANLRKLAASGSNTAEPEPEFLRRAIKQSTSDVKEGLPATWTVRIEGIAARAEQRLLDAGGDASGREVEVKVKVGRVPATPVKIEPPARGGIEAANETSDSEEEQEATVES